ncbi:hypothetical protein [Phaeodactylibacter xiamenensis]|uniref:hypothetical protein n=1 Tax=Phaeodactylibacter xiamenensis TaxID=1524460 RepID=UPI0024A9A338|nr:hypothetical protein [Phaeodactylibacter xiamenensis]
MRSLRLKQSGSPGSYREAALLPTAYSGTGYWAWSSWAAVPSAVTVVQAAYSTVAPDNDYRYNGKELNG